MPTLFRYRGYAFRIYLNDHEPPHVHIVGAEGEAIFDLASLRVVRIGGLPRSLLQDLALKALDESAGLLREWERIHGSQGTTSASDRRRV